MPSRRSSKKDSPAKLAGRMKRRWRVVLLRSKGEILGTVEAPDVATARRPQRSSLISTKSSATGSWCRSLVEGDPAREVYREASWRSSDARGIPPCLYTTSLQS
jgi:hypothetical protein